MENWENIKDSNDIHCRVAEENCENIGDFVLKYPCNLVIDFD